MKNILITGGAGFIGIHLSNELVNQGYSVTVLDNLSPHVHGLDSERPIGLNPSVKLVIGDVRDVFTINDLVIWSDAIFHFASIGSADKSLAQIQELNDVNNIGTSVLVESVIKNPVKKLILASSMCVYGEGYYSDSKGNTYQNLTRSLSDLENKQWDFINRSGEFLLPLPCNEQQNPRLDSMYSITKFDQEKICMLVGEAYNIPVVSLRFFNVYGPGQSFESRYSDVLSGFISRFLNGQPPLVFEDGNQIRDFLYISDAVRVCQLALEKPSANGHIINVGSGIPRTILSLAQHFTRLLDPANTYPVITEQFRFKEARHSFADVSKLYELLGFEPRVSIEEGIQKTIAWLEDPSLVNELKKQLH